MNLLTPVYLKDDPAQCICRGAGEYWAVGKAPEVFNVFAPFWIDPDDPEQVRHRIDPDFPDLDVQLVPCEKHRNPGLSFADFEMMDLCGIALPSGSLPAE